MTKKSFGGLPLRLAAILVVPLSLVLADRTLVDIVVAENIKTELRAKLDRLAADLENEGYTARITSWPAGKSAGDVWEHLRDAYDNDNLQGALLVGHIPAPVMKNDDGQYPRNTDMPYWKMVGDSIDLSGKIRTWNIWVGRFYSDRLEVERIGNALETNHAYRTGSTRLAHKAFTNRGSDWGGMAKARELAQTALEVWPESEAVSTPGEALWSAGGDFLVEVQHGTESWYSDVSIRKLFQKGCTIRFIFNNSCHSGALGGVVNTQILLPDGYNVVSVGASKPGHTFYQLFIDHSGDSCRKHLVAGEPWGRSLLMDFAFRKEGYKNASVTIIYGDLSVPPMMYPEKQNLPGKAGNPRPAFDEHVVDLNASLQWASRVGTQSHDVYFGTDARLDAGDFQGNQTTNSYNPGPLSPGITYYWRVDATNASGTTKGGVWQFTTDDGHEKLCIEGYTMPLYSATKNIVAGVKFSVDKPIRISEIIVDNLLVGSRDNVGIWREVDTDAPLHVLSMETGATRSKVSLPVDIVLSGGRYVIAALFEEYSYDRVEDVRIARGIEIIHPVNQESSTLTYPTRGYTSDEPGRRRIKGHVNFRFAFVGAPIGPPGKAASPTPSNEATDVSIDTELSWSPGTGATSHIVYFGTDATPDEDEKQGTQTATVFDPGPLETGTTYYWRIDEVNEYGTTEGEVWSFTTGDDAVGVGRLSLKYSPLRVIFSYGTRALHFGPHAETPVVIDIVDMQGRRVLEESLEQTAGTCIVPLPLRAHGVYVVTVRTPSSFVRRTTATVGLQP